jgi:hypothetical protein
MNRTTLTRLLSLLTIAAAVGIVGCVIYCAVWWEPSPMTWTDLDSSFACWGFCATQSPVWGAVAVALALGLAGTGALFWRQPHRYAGWLLGFGLLTLPFGAVGVAAFALHRLSPAE